MQDPLAKIKQKLLEEIDQLSHELNVDLPKEIAVARAHGDLSENAEYKYAKERQGFVNARISQLKKRLGDLGMLNLTNIPKDRAGFGSRLTVLDMQRDIKIEYKLGSTEEADAEHGLISPTSPIGKALLNRKVGDEIEVATPAGKKEFEVVRLVTIHEEEKRPRSLVRPNQQALRLSTSCEVLCGIRQSCSGDSARSSGYSP